MFGKPSAAMMRALRDFVIRHEIFVEACEFDDGRIFTRRPWRLRRLKRLGPRRHFEVFLRRGQRRIRFVTLTCGSEDHERSQVWIDFPEKVLLRSAEAAVEFESCGRNAKRFAAGFPKDAEAGRALFGYVRAESRLLRKLLGDTRYKGLLRIVRRYRRGSQRRTKSALQK